MFLRFGNKSDLQILSAIADKWSKDSNMAISGLIKDTYFHEIRIYTTDPKELCGNKDCWFNKYRNMIQKQLKLNNEWSYIVCYVNEKVQKQIESLKAIKSKSTLD